MRFRLPMTVCYFAPLGADNFGRPTLAAPVELPARWEDLIEETIGPDGSPTLSSAVVYLASDVIVGGLLYLGLLTAVTASGFPANPKEGGAREIVNRSKIPSITAGQFLYRAALK